jgi:hypothetical protein
VSFLIGLATIIEYQYNPNGLPPSTGGTFTGTMNYYGSSLDVTGFSATDLNLNPVSLSQITSNSGVALTSTGYATAAPEPSTIAMLLAGFAACGIRTVRRRSGK